MVQYFAGPGLSKAENVALRQHLATCAACAGQWLRLQKILGEHLGMGVQRSTAYQRDVLFSQVWDSVKDSAVAAEQPTPGLFHQWTLVVRGVLALGLIMAIVLVPRLPEPDRNSRGPGTTRGSNAVLPGAALGLSGVDSEGMEYEVVQAGEICQHHGLRLYARVRQPELRFVFVFALQDGSTEPTWYFPNEEEDRSLEVRDFDAPWVFPEEIPISPNHGPGPLTVVSVFGRRPLTVEDVGALWQDSPHGIVGSTERTKFFQDSMEEEGFLVQWTRLTVVPCSGEGP
jgi:hypothetical protein